MNLAKGKKVDRGVFLLLRSFHAKQHRNAPRMSGLPPTFVDGFHDAQAAAAMPYRHLAPTDMVLSAISLGQCEHVPMCLVSMLIKYGFNGD